MTLCIHIELEYVGMVWGETEVTLVCPPGGTEPFIAISELIEKVRERHIVIATFVYTVYYVCVHLCLYNTVVHLYVVQ